VIGQDRYVSALAARIKSSGSLRSNRVKALELTVPDDAMRIQGAADLIEYLATTAYGARRLTTTKVWTIVLNGSAGDTKALKLALLSRGINFEDGFEDLEFQAEIFAQQPVINTSGSNISKTSYDVRLMTMDSFNLFVDAGYKFDVVVLTSGLNTEQLKSGSRFDSVEVLGLEQGHIKKVLEVSR
jgi:hypothetical protein